jgi:hypothetical protein
MFNVTENTHRTIFNISHCFAKSKITVGHGSQLGVKAVPLQATQALGGRGDI